MKLEFNRAPYFDDHDPESNYARVVFKDGVPIQARELNNVQGIMQDQIRSFGDHVFTNGSRVSGARMRDIDHDYVVLNPVSPWDNLTVKTEVLTEGVVLRGKTTQLKAVVVSVDTSSDQIVMFVVYKGTAIDGETRTFIKGETIEVLDEHENVFYTLTIPCPTCDATTTDTYIIGKGTIFTIEEGVFYYNGMFLNSDRQSIVISLLTPIAESDTTAKFDVGFDVQETIVTHEDDVSLFDNSLGYPNRAAPGADRYKVNLVLTKRLDTDSRDNYFIILGSYVGGRKIFSKADSEYSEIMDFIAKRTYEESGNYTIRPQEIRFLEHKAQYPGDPQGFDVAGSNDNYVISVSPNISYVQGYRYQNTIDRYVVTPKARDTKKLTSYIHQFEELSYILLKPKLGTSAYPNSPITPNKVYDESLVELYDGPVSTGVGGSFLPTGAKIGTLKMFDASLESGTPGSGTAVYRYYVYDITFAFGKSFADVKSVYHPTNKFICDPVLENGVMKIHNQGRAELIWRIKKDNIKSLRDAQTHENGSLVLTRRVKLMGTLDSQGTITFTPDEGEVFVALGLNSIAVLTTSGVPSTIDLNSFSVEQSPNSIKVNLGQSHSGKEFLLITNSVLTKIKERTKRVLVTTDTVTSLTETEKIVLTKGDIKTVRKITAYLKSAIENKQAHVDIPLTLFEVNSGQTDTAYRNGWIKMLQGQQFPETVHQRMGDYNILIEYDYYEHSGPRGVFTVDSYSGPIQSGDLTYSTIPGYKAASGTEYPLAFCFDFRPLIIDNEIKGDPLFPAIGEMAFFDLEYYLPRCDLLQIDRHGNITTKLGIASDTPIPPKVDDGQMALFELWSLAYTHELTDIKFKRIDNKRYTMRDIGRLDSRLKKVEYYTVLNLLEKSAKDMSIKDVDGADRFKNGFIADNFQNFQAADINSPEFRSAIDRTRSEMRPTFGSRNRKLVFDPAQSSHYAITGGMITLPYVSVLAVEQPYATKNISINPYFMFNKKGTLTLTPNVNTWVNTTVEPDMVITQDFGTEAFEGMTNRMNSDWGAWNDANRTGRGVGGNTAPAATPTASNLVDAFGMSRQGATRNAAGTVPAPVVSPTPARPPVGSVSATNPLAGTFSAPKTNATNGNPVAGGRVDTYDFGSRLTDVSLTPFMLEVDITMTATKMAANTKVYAFFDGVPVSQFCRPIDGEFGDQMITSADGTLSAIFRVPTNTFRVGDKKVKLSGSPDNSSDPDVIITWAENSFYSAGIDQTIQSITMNAISPTFNYDAQRDAPITARVIPDDWSGIRESSTRGDTRAADNAAAVASGVAAARRAQGIRRRGNAGGGIDPVAQSFMMEESSFITKIDLYFATVDTENDVIWVELRTMENGYPTEIALARKEYLTSEIAISEDSTLAHTVNFDSPVYIQGGVEYCFVVGGWSPNTRIWVARVGDKIVNDPSHIVETQPALGSSFRSQNGSTWNAEQFEDIKFKIYVAQFTERSMELVFKASHQGEIIEADAFEFESGSNRVRVFIKDHAIMPGDTVKLFPLTGTTVTVESTSRPMFNETVTTPSGSFKVHDVVAGSVAQQWIVTIKNLTGKIVALESFTTPTTSGTVIEGTASSINGIAVDDIADTHIVLDVDSRNSFIIQTASNATVSGISGTKVGIECNVGYNVINASCSYMKYTCDETWSYEGIVSNPYTSEKLLPDYSRMNSVFITPAADVHLSQPYKIVTPDNASMMGVNVLSDTILRVVITSPSEFMSAILNPETMSVTLVNNRVGAESANMDVAPNAANRYKPETDPTSGSELFKYLTRKVILSKPADDLYIMFDAYKDDVADFDIYYRHLSPEDVTDIETHNWTLIPINKSSSKGEEKIEYEVRLSEVFESTWATHGPISTFQVKIVGRTVNSSNPPLFANLRIIAAT